MPKISEQRRDERRAQILAAAIRCFARNGYHRTSMADIIAESGLSAGAIYGYFSGKQELIQAVARSAVQGRFDELPAVHEGRVLDPVEIAQNLIGGVRSSVPTAMLLQVWAEAAVNQQTRMMFQELIDTIRTIITQHLERWASADPELTRDAAAWARRTAPLLLSLTAGFILQSTLIDGFDEEAYLAAIPELLRSEHRS